MNKLQRAELCYDLHRWGNQGLEGSRLQADDSTRSPSALLLIATTAYCHGGHCLVHEVCLAQVSVLTLPTSPALLTFLHASSLPGTSWLSTHSVPSSHGVSSPSPAGWALGMGWLEETSSECDSDNIRSEKDQLSPSSWFVRLIKLGASLGADSLSGWQTSCSLLSGGTCQFPGQGGGHFARLCAPRGDEGKNT